MWPRRSRFVPLALWLSVHLAAAVSVRLAGQLAALLWFVPWQRRERVAGATSGTAPRDTDAASAVLGNAGDIEVLLDREGGGRRTRHVLPVRAAARGPAVLLVHGWSDRGEALDAFVGPLVATGRRVVAIDLPAHGSVTGRRTDAFEVSLAIHQVAMKVEADVVVAHSLGALATMMAMRDGLTLRGVVLLAPLVRLDHALDGFVAGARLPARAGAGLRYVLERRFGPRVWDDLAMDRHAAGFRPPGLIVHDRDDRQVPLDGARQLAATWPMTELIETTGLGHRRLLHDPGVIECVAGYVSQLDASGDAGSEDPEPGRGPAGIAS